MAVPRTKSRAAKAIELQNIVAEGATVALPEGISIETLVATLAPYATGALETLGKEAAEGGNVQAAKIVLEFLTAASKEKSSKRTSDVLRRIAEVRRVDTP